jgi:hypothetical protein
MKKELKVVDVGVAVFFSGGGNDVGEILLFVLLGSLPPAALIAFLVDLLILVVVLAIACTCRVGFANPPAGDNVNTTSVAPMVTRIAWLIVTILLPVALCRGLSLPVGCGAFSLDCLLSGCSGSDDTSPSSSLLPFCFPREGRLHQYPLLRLFRPVRLPCLLLVGVAFVVDTGEAYPPAPSEAVLWIPLSGVASMF